VGEWDLGQELFKTNVATGVCWMSLENKNFLVDVGRSGLDMGAKGPFVDHAIGGGTSEVKECWQH